MPKTVEEKLAQPSINIKIPEIKLRLEDVAFLRSLDSPTEIKCVIDRNKMQRLYVLRLVEQRKVPPTQDVVKKIEAEYALWKAKAQKAFEIEDWDTLTHIAYEGKRIKQRLEPRPTDVITEFGRQLLENGAVTVKMKKTGCV